MILNLSNPDSSLLDLIDWSAILSELQKRAILAQTKRAITQPLEFKSESELQNYYKQINQKISLILESRDRHIFSQLQFLASLEEKANSDLISANESLSKNKFFNIDELNLFVFAVETYQELFAKSENYIFDNKLKHSFEKYLIKPFRRICNEDGEVFYDRHPEVKALQEEIIELENRIRKKITQLMSDSLYQPALQIQNFDVIYNRFVLIIKSDSYRSKMGSILFHSDSGKSLYVEPFEIAKLSNKRIELISKRDEIINRICIEFSEFLFANQHFIYQIFNKIHSFDLLIAKASFCLDFNLNEPEIHNVQTYRLSGIFHPLVENCIPNDFNFLEDKLGFVISGPNTGGKTVLLKSVALSCLLPNYGLFIPSKHSEIPFTKNVFYLGNDQQDLDAGLSSFSAEAKNYCKLILELREIEVKGESSIVIIDEIFNSTSSEDASALAMALFEEIEKINHAKIIISTHHQMLKTLTHENHKFQSSHVGFDLELKKPTYKLINDLPGASMAIDIFKNLSENLEVSEQIAEKAEKLLDSKHVVYEKLLHEISQKNVKLDKVLNENREINTQLKNQKDANDGILKLKMQDAFKRYEGRLDRLMSKLEIVIQNAKKNPEFARKNTKGLIHEIKSEFIQSKPSNNKEKPNLNLKSVSQNQIKEGILLYSKSIEKMVKILKVMHRKNKVQAQNGVMKIELDFDDLFFSKNEFLKEQKRLEEERKKHQSVIEFSDNIDLEMDCRGMRLIDFETFIENQLGYLLSGHIPYTTIIHGHGDGVLKTWLKNRIKKDKNFLIHDANEGNDGASTIKLK